ncbi:hypothetical protein [Haloprofundus salilacus]|nr:hypothetical protein [Haloprofundus salilacus]
MELYSEEILSTKSRVGREPSSASVDRRGGVNYSAVGDGREPIA